jgi:hypothetical protein
MRVRSSVLVSSVMVLLVVSVGVNVLQAQKILALVSRTATATSMAGKSVPSLRGKSLDGQEVEIQLKGSAPTILYHFSSTCPWCDRNWRNLETVVQAANGRYRVIAVTTEAGMKSYVEAKALNVEVVEQLDDDAARALNLAGTPRTMAIGADGVVSHDWAGAYASRIARQVEDLFGVRLPGLQPTLAANENSRPQ